MRASVATMNVRSKDGVDIKDLWAGGIRTYLGLLVRGFPNCFLSYSPQGVLPLQLYSRCLLIQLEAPTAFSNGPTILECQVDWIVDAITKMEKEGLATIEPTEEAENEWRDKIVEAGSKTLFAETDSWWTGANIPGKKKEFLTYIGGIGQYEPEVRATLEDWKGFEVKKRS
jgi:hypothetical protein